jgi:hypothetical protein
MYGISGFGIYENGRTVKECITMRDGTWINIDSAPEITAKGNTEPFKENPVEVRERVWKKW